MLIGIIRGAKKEFIEKIVETGFSAGLSKIEITLNTPGALEMIESVSKKWEIGAGTVLNLDAAKQAVAAGAKFIVSPVTDPATIEFCKEKKIPVYAGALTPGEVYRAWELGSDMVKVFPASLIGGPSYIRELKAPFEKIKLLACGGVTEENIKEYFRAGASAAAVGNSVFKRPWMESNNFEAIAQKIKSLLRALAATA